MMGAHLRFALHVFVMSLIACAVIGALTFLVVADDAPPKLMHLTFWSLGCAVFLATLGFALARLTFVPALVVGFAAGLLFLIISFYPRGLWPGPFSLPMFVIWPLMGMIGFGYAASAKNRERAPAGNRSWALALPVGLVAAALFVLFLKGALNLVAEPLDFARYQPRRPPRPNIENVMAVPTKASAPAQCAERSGPRRLTDAGIVIDSSIAVKPRGTLTDIRQAASGKSYGHRVALWESEGMWHGYLEQFSGTDQPRSALLEQVSVDPESYHLRFQAFFADGFLAEFSGSFHPGNMQGKLEIVDGECKDRKLASNDLVLTRDDDASNAMLGHGQPKTLHDFGVLYDSIYRRAAAPTFPDPPYIDGVITVAGRFWWPEGTSAAAFSARFNAGSDMQRYLDAERVVANHGGRELRMKDVLFAHATDERANIASWILIGPTEALREYTRQLHVALANKDGLQNMSYGTLPVKLMD